MMQLSTESSTTIVMFTMTIDGNGKMADYEAVINAEADGVEDYNATHGSFFKASYTKGRIYPTRDITGCLIRMKP